MSASAFGIILLELLLVSWIDLKTQKISNKWILINMSLSVIFHFLWNSDFTLSWQTFYYPAGFVIIGFFLFLLNIMGAGDSKFLASLFLVIPSQLHYNFFEKILITTMFIGAVLLLFRVIKNFTKFKVYLLTRHWAGIKGLIKSRFSYAPVILIAWILFGTELWK